MRDVFVRGIGLHTTLARGVPGNVAALEKPPTSPKKISVDCGRSKYEVPFYLLADTPLVDAEQRFFSTIDNVIADALTDSQLDVQTRRSLALFVGSSCADMPVIETQYQLDLQRSNEAIPMAYSSSLGNLATKIRARFELRGPDYSFYTACTASANALLAAANMIRQRKIDHALVVGIEIFNAITALGFSGLQLLTNDVMRPFDRRRNGLVPGEACAAIVLSAEQADHPWRILGGANLCDTHSISATNPNGSAVELVIHQALKDAEVETRDIVAIKMHGTASLSNDEAESAGVRRVFTALPPLCALKPYLGHTFGACGVVELALFCGSVANEKLPAAYGIAIESDLDVSLNQTLQSPKRGAFMLNYFGFGGSNTSLIASNS